MNKTIPTLLLTSALAFGGFATVAGSTASAHRDGKAEKGERGKHGHGHHGCRGKRRGHGPMAFARGLELTDDQKSTLRLQREGTKAKREETRTAIRQQRQAYHEAVIAGGRNSSQAKAARSKLIELEKTKTAQRLDGFANFVAVLNAEQKAKLKEKMAERQARRAERQAEREQRRADRKAKKKK